MAEHDEIPEVGNETAAENAPEVGIVSAATEEAGPAVEEAAPALASEGVSEHAEPIPTLAWEDGALFRAASAEAAEASEEATPEAVIRERERLAAERQARKEARLAALQPQPQPAPEASAVIPVVAASEPVKPTVSRRTTDKFLPSLGLFLVRLVVAAIMGIHGMEKLLNVQKAADVFASTVLPQPQILALVVGAAEVGVAIALVFGLATRLAGLGVTLVTGGALAFVLWGPWSPFVPGRAGFVGETELLLAVVGILLLCTGGGGWAIDRGFRARRAADKAERANLA